MQRVERTEVPADRMAQCKLSQCSTMRWMSLTARVRVSNPVRLTPSMAQRYFDPGIDQEISSHQAANVRHTERVRHRLRWTSRTRNAGV